MHAFAAGDPALYRNVFNVRPLDLKELINMSLKSRVCVVAFICSMLPVACPF